ncbi:hypothetical protein DAI22_05g166300 [Oryza sativa Japonica Group]|nr:hypothetical protein DAI22_05g166300 [Oryza sativa Japonica Group]
METPFSAAGPPSPCLDRWHRHVAVSSINVLLPPLPQDPPLPLRTHCLQYGASTNMRSIEKFIWLLEVLYKEEGDQ